jgi:integrase/recombinase XerC
MIAPASESHPERASPGREHVSTILVEKRGGRVVVVDDRGVIKEDCARFLERIGVRGLSPCTVEAYAYDLALIHRWLAASGGQLTELTAEGVHRFLAWERGRASHPKSINRRLHTLRLFYRFVVGQELPGGLERHGNFRPYQRDRELGIACWLRASVRQMRVKEPKVLVEPLTIDQVRNLLSSMRRYRDLCLAYSMLLCGLRSQEAIDLHLGDLDFDDHRIRVRGKGNKERAVPLPGLLMNLIRRYLKLERPLSCATDHVFVVLQGKRRGHPLTRTALRRVFRTRRSRPALTNANPHRLRHTFGADMARSGVRLPILQRMMGHAYAETTLRYVNVSMTEVATEFHRAVEVLESRYGTQTRP